MICRLVSYLTITKVIPNKFGGMKPEFSGIPPQWPVPMRGISMAARLIWWNGVFL